MTSLNYYGTVELVDVMSDLLAKNHGSVILISSNSAPMSSYDAYVAALLDYDEQITLNIVEQIDGHQAYSGSKTAIVYWKPLDAA